MKTKFSVGDYVIAKATAQGLIAGAEYEVTAIKFQPIGVFGVITYYTVRQILGEVDDADMGYTPPGYNGPSLIYGKPVTVMNGHLILASVEEEVIA